MPGINDVLNLSDDGTRCDPDIHYHHPTWRPIRIHPRCISERFIVGFVRGTSCLALAFIRTVSTGLAHPEKNGIDHDEVIDSMQGRAEEKSLSDVDVLLARESMISEIPREPAHQDRNPPIRQDRGNEIEDDDYVLTSPSFVPLPEVGPACPVGVNGQETLLPSNSTVEPAKAATSRAPDDGMGRFQVLWPHARGGLGQIFVAQDLQLHRRVALKEILPELAENPNSRARFLIEAEITGNLEHPGIVPVYAQGERPDGHPFYAMRFIKGEDLATAAHRFHQDHSLNFTGLEFRWLLRRFVNVCNTVAYAHSRGVLHRDIKPGNIMLGSFGETLVMDWGVAKAMDRPESIEASPPFSAPTSIQTDGSPIHPNSVNATVTINGQVVGTPAYMSPEQASGDLEAMTPASDVYSLGATLHAMLTDRPPFSGDPVAVLRDVRLGRLDSPRAVRPSVPRALDAICRKAMSREPSHRYSSTLAMSDDIERWLADEPVTSYREPISVRGRRWMKRHLPLLAGAVAAVVVITVALGLAVPILSIARRNEADARRAESRQRVLATPESRGGRGTTRARGEGPEIPGRGLPKARSHRRGSLAQGRQPARSRGQGPGSLPGR